MSTSFKPPRAKRMRLTTRPALGPEPAQRWLYDPATCMTVQCIDFEVAREEATERIRVHLHPADLRSLGEGCTLPVKEVLRRSLRVTIDERTSSPEAVLHRYAKQSFYSASLVPIL